MEKKRKKLELRITFESDSEFDVFVDFFRRQKKNPRGVVLDALRLLWEPYVLADVEDLSFGELERLIDISFQRYMSHYELMCVELGLRRPGGFSPGESDRNRDFSLGNSNRNVDFSPGNSDRNVDFSLDKSDRNRDFSLDKSDRNRDFSLDKSDRKDVNDGSLSGSLGGVSVSSSDAETQDEGKDDEASVDDLLEINLVDGGGFDFD